MRALLVESGGVASPSVEHMLKSEGITVATMNLGAEGIDLAKLHSYDVIILNLNLPDMSAANLLRSLRAARIKAPVLVLFGFSGVEEMIKELGADGCMVKPPNKDEFISRLFALVRRSKRSAEAEIVVGDLLINLELRIVEVAGNRVHLTEKEFQMLELLALRKGTTLTKEMFLSHLYGGVKEPDLKIIDVFICKLRKKIANASGGKNYIETVWGRGYVLRNPAAEIPAAPQEIKIPA